MNDLTMDKPIKRRRLSEVIKVQKDSTDQDFWTDLNRRIREGSVIPIIGNSVRTNRIFDIDFDYNVGLGEGNRLPGADELNIDEELAEMWAEHLQYPLAIRHNLAQVAMYNRVESADAEQAKAKYLNFLKTCLLNLAEEDPAVSELATELKQQVVTLGFSDIAAQLDYPKKSNRRLDPLRTLARLPLAVYLTTSPHDFMERALQAEGRTPRTQICFWDGEPRDVAPQHRHDSAFIPTAGNPVVYHLYGFEQYPESIVLSEDDYLDFLVKISQDSDSSRPLIPLYLWEVLAESSLILLGYRLYDWDFRVLFRGIINSKHGRLRKFSLAIQLDPANQGEIVDRREAQSYLQNYFGPSRFKVVWGNPESFVETLWEAWNTWRQSQT